MASTYSTNLKLQLMATGENTGTWGSVTNTNLGTALEEAIVGSVDVTFASADVTLSLTNTNANQTARNMRLVLVGVSGGARQLVVPAIEKIYIVKNELADTCTVKVSGQTGVAVPAGKTMWLCNDGTDVKDVVTHLSSLTLASPLPVGSGGTGATSLNGIAFTGENITNLNASNISSGTLANARTTASSSNGASTIVARGASGEFAAGAITGASFSGDGSGLTALNASTISTGTLANARTTASSANGASTIVTRDASGNFSANVITADGSGLTALNASNISTGTVANARTTASSSNGASTIVTRDASGNFSANTITASLTGTASGNLTSGSALNATNLTSGTVASARFPSRSLINYSYYSTGTVQTLSGYTIIPIDNTVPLDTEGALAYSTTYSCTEAGSTVLVQAVVTFCSSSAQRILTAALFTSASSSAIGTAIQHEADNGYVHQLIITASILPGTTASRTYSVRISDNGGNALYLNSNGSTGIFAGTMVSSLTFHEFKA